MTALSVALSERKGSGHSTVLERAHRAYSTALIQELEKAVRFYGRAEKMCQAILCRARAGNSIFYARPSFSQSELG